jgi:REP element-mobilizing transposase RayT
MKEIFNGIEDYRELKKSVFMYEFRRQRFLGTTSLKRLRQLGTEIAQDKGFNISKPEIKKSFVLVF